MILFDVDGVLLSEERYFDASALTVWEMLASKHYMGLDSGRFQACPEEALIRQVRREVFADDRALKLIKARGINANWDMVYLAFSYQLVRALAALYPLRPKQVESWLNGSLNREALQEIGDALPGDFALDYAAFVDDFGKSEVVKHEMLLYLNQLVKEKTGIETRSFSRNSPLWDLCQETFQEWYLGDALVKESIGREAYQKGKRGFLNDEIPIVPPEKMSALLAGLKKKGLVLGIGTGRPQIETVEPLKALGLLQHYDANRVVSASTVLQAEKTDPSRAPLAKPHPYCYLKGIFGMDTPDQDIFTQALPLSNADEILIVGDSLADYLAARAIGCRFAATLTGLSGQAARADFESRDTDYILNDVLELETIFNV
jgi:phosphoglycolate phosphatase-like HAD superfamily hydrolase